MACITLPNEATKFLGKKKSVKILVVGKTGVGKSALINALAAKEVSKESEIDTGTNTVKKLVTEFYGGIEAIFYDTPGLHDAKGKEKEYLQEIIDECKDIDLILFCSKLTETRITEEDCEAICIFTRVLGKDLWKNCVFVFTFANKVRPKKNIRDPEVKKKALQDKFDIMSKEFREILRSKAGVHSSVVKGIPFVPAGYHTGEHRILPDGSDWFSAFWMACFVRVRDEGKPAVITGCLDMFLIESEKIKELPRKYQYPMPALSPMPDFSPTSLTTCRCQHSMPIPPQPHEPPPAYSEGNYTSLVAPSGRRSIPMKIRLTEPSLFEMLYDSVQTVANGFGLPGKITSGIMKIGKVIIKEFLEE